MAQSGVLGTNGSLAIQVKHAPRSPLSYRIRNAHNIFRGWWKHQVALLLGIGHYYGQLSAVVKHADGTTINYGVISTRVVTNAGVGAIVDAFQNTFELENFKYHGVGTGSTAESASDTALVTESTTVLNPDSTRATGTTTEGASVNIYRTVGTVTFDGTAAIVEHGIFSASSTGTGVLLDRSVFAAINVVSADSISFTYELTFASGG